MFFLRQTLILAQHVLSYHLMCLGSFLLAFPIFMNQESHRAMKLFFIKTRHTIFSIHVLLFFSLFHDFTPIRLYSISIASAVGERGFHFNSAFFTVCTVLEIKSNALFSLIVDCTIAFGCR